MYWTLTTDDFKSVCLTLKVRKEKITIGLKDVWLKVHIPPAPFSKVPLKSVENLPLASCNLNRVCMGHIIIPVFTA